MNYPNLNDIISEIKKNPYSDAYIIACFDDTGLDACRSFTDKPVLGIGECSYHAANLLGGNFSVITTLSRSIPALKGNLKKYGITKYHRKKFKPVHNILMKKTRETQ